MFHKPLNQAEYLLWTTPESIDKRGHYQVLNHIRISCHLCKFQRYTIRHLVSLSVFMTLI